MPDDIYKLPPDDPNLTEDDVYRIVVGVLSNYNIPTKVSGSFLQSANFKTGVQGWQLRPDGAEVNGTFSVTQINIPNTTTAASFHASSNGDTWWGANVADWNADHANADAYVLNTGEAHFANITVTGGTIPASVITGLPPATTDISAQDWTYSGTFSATDADTVAWTAGNLKFSDGTTYAIGAGDTGNMAAKTYIYVDNAASTTSLQTTTTAGTAVGTGHVLIAVAENDVLSATFTVMNDKTKSINASDIVAGSITTNRIAAGAITAGLINVTNLSAISADLGTITAGSITINGGVASISNTGDAVFKSIQIGGSSVQYTIGDEGTGTFGNGVDGSADLDGFNIYPWASVPVGTPLGVSYTLLHDVYLTDLIIRGGSPGSDIYLETAGYRIFGIGTLTLESALGSGAVIRRNGNDGGSGGSPIPQSAPNTPGNPGGLAVPDGYLKGSPAGGDGGGTGPTGLAEAGDDGTPVVNSIGVAGVNGGGSGDTPVAATPSNVRLVQTSVIVQLLDVSSSGSTVKMTGSASSGGGNSNNTGSAASGPGGGGGSPGAIVAIYFRNIIIGASASIQSNGGAGGSGGSNGAAGTGAGGAGGSGGAIVLVYNTLTNNGDNVSTGLLATAGVGGSASAAPPGASGNPGIIYEFQVSI